jgi:protoporphyrinogen IX oxidase
MDWYNLARGLHILAVIAWMAGLLFLPRLYAYDAEQADKPDAVRDGMREQLRLWQTRLLKIILNPAMIVALVVGLWLIHLRGAVILAQPWIWVKLVGVFLLLGWHGFLVAERKRILAGTSTRTSRFWRMTNEVPFVLAVLMVLSVTLEWTF